MNGIKVSHLTYHYHKKCILRDINLLIPLQQMICLIGPNGSGKSTLLKLMGGLLSLQSGTVTLDNISLHSYSRKSLAKKLAFLPQQCQIPPSLLVREYVALGRFCHQSWFSKLSYQDHFAIDEAIALTGLNLLAREPVSALSAGQQQRARLALMLTQQAHYLLLDEPMTGLDFKQQRNMLKLLSDLQKNHGKTIIVILHDLHQVMEIANEVVLLNDSRILTQGHPRDVICKDNVLKAFDCEYDFSFVCV